jgi:hypothetical protein
MIESKWAYKIAKKLGAKVKTVSRNGDLKTDYHVYGSFTQSEAFTAIYEIGHIDGSNSDSSDVNIGKLPKIEFDEELIKGTFVNIIK